jgi:hypothetical protein
MSDPTSELVQSDAIIAEYRAELERLNYVRGSINVYLRSIRRLFQLMVEQSVALGDLTPDVAADLVHRAPAVVGFVSAELIPTSWSPFGEAACEVKFAYGDWRSANA